MNEVMELVKIQTIEIGKEKVNAVDARELHERLCVLEQFNHWIERRLEETMALESTDYGVLVEKNQNPLGGRPSKEYVLTLDIAKHIAMLERTETGKKIRQYFIEVEKRMRGNVMPVVTIDDLKSNPSQAIQNMELALQAMKAYEAERIARELAEAARDKAEKERLWIRSKAEATAMATASVKSRALEKLKLEMGEHKEYASILRVALATVTSEKDYNWRPLKQYSQEHGLEIHSIPDPRFGKVKTYHKDAWYNIYDVDLEELFA